MNDDDGFGIYSFRIKWTRLYLGITLSLSWLNGSSPSGEDTSYGRDIRLRSTLAEIRDPTVDIIP